MYLYHILMDSNRIRALYIMVSREQCRILHNPHLVSGVSTNRYSCHCSGSDPSDSRRSVKMTSFRTK